MAKVYNKLTELGKAVFNAVVDMARKLCVSTARPTTMFLDQMKPEIIEVDGETAQKFKPFDSDCTIIIKKDGSLAGQDTVRVVGFNLEGHWAHAYPVTDAGEDLLTAWRKANKVHSWDDVPEKALGASMREIKHAACGWVMGKSPKSMDQMAVRYLVKHHLNKDVCHFLFKYQGTQWTLSQYNMVLRWLPQLQEMERIGPGLISVWIRMARKGSNYGFGYDVDIRPPMEALLEWRKKCNLTPAAWKWALTASPATWRMTHDASASGPNIKTLSDPRLVHLRPTVANRLIRAGMLPADIAKTFFSFDDGAEHPEDTVHIKNQADAYQMRMTMLCALAKTQPKRGILAWCEQAIKEYVYVLDMLAVPGYLHGDAEFRKVTYDHARMKNMSWANLKRMSDAWHEELRVFYRELRAQQDAEYAKRMAHKAALEWKSPLLEFEAGKLKAIALTKGQQLLDEGTEMEHCVAGYIDTCFEGQSHIYSVRQDDKRVSTIEIRVESEGPIIRQNYGRGNSAVPASVKKFGESLLVAFKKALVAPVQQS